MIIAGTGHRPSAIGGFDLPNPTYIHVCTKIEKNLLELKPDKVLSGMALGYDQWIANIAIKLKIPVIAVIPFIGQEKAWPKESQIIYNKLLDKCEDKLIICDGGYAAYKMQIRNEKMCDLCDILLACYIDNSKGGTYNCIQYAKKINKHIVYRANNMIIVNNEEALRVKCEKVLPEEINDLVLKLEFELQRSAKLGFPGIGLAAPQIGIAKDIAIVRFGEHKFNLINAKIIKKYDPTIFKEEGCLSFPGRVENTIRYQEIVVENFEYPENFIATGLLAAVCQHEIDHLNSKLFFDNLAQKQVLNKKIGPNDKCFCNSGKKFKKCCYK